MHQTMFPASLAIAGGWGYIGQKFISAALKNGINVWVMDTGNVPEFIDTNVVKHIYDEQEFLSLPAAMYHLALHPQHRGPLLHALMERSMDEPGIPILVEKPLVSWDKPQNCNEIIKQVESGRAFVFYDFLELFDPMTSHIINYLKQFQEVSITDVVLKRSKDREDPAIPRNYKPMQPIQYQESCHCLAFLIFILANINRGLEASLSVPLTICAQSCLYNSPAPELFPRPVDGRCEAEIHFGEIAVTLYTDFKRGAPWQKTKIINGIGDGTPFCIEAEYLEGAKVLAINGVDQGFAPDSDSCEHVLAGIWRMVHTTAVADDQKNIYPDVAIARWVYVLSAILHQSCATGKPVQIPCLAAL